MALWIKLKVYFKEQRRAIVIIALFLTCVYCIQSLLKACNVELHAVDTNNHLTFFPSSGTIVQMGKRGISMIDIIKACTDLGTHVCGAELGPDKIMETIHSDKIAKVIKIEKQSVKKQLEPENKRKNIEAINVFNQALYTQIVKTIEEGNFPITLGGDHSIAIGSALGSIQHYQNMGIIWLDAHADYNTFATTITGNIHGLPFATVTGRVEEGLTYFHHGSFYRPQNGVLVGARSIDMPKELENLKEAGITIYTEEDVKQMGIENVMEKAFEIALRDTNGVHVSLDLDAICPVEAPGVSIPEEGNFTKEEFITAVMQVIKHKSDVKSVDLVEFNPLFDQEDKTLAIAREVLLRFIHEIG